MADHSSMTYEAMASAARNMTAAGESIEEVIQRINSATEALGQGWQGDGYTAFQNAWKESEPKMKKLAQAIAEFAPGLNKAADRQRETDAASAAGMASLGF